MTAQDAYKVMLRDQISPALRTLGFKGSNGSYELPDPNFWVLIGFQKSTGNTASRVKFTVNVTVGSRSAWEEARERGNYPARPSPNVRYGVAFHEDRWQKRVGQLLGVGDKWWVLDSSTSPDAVASEVLATISEVVVPAIRQELGVKPTLDPSGRTPLHYAAMDNDVERVAALLAEGTEVDATDHAGSTPLHMACQHGALDAARLLLDSGAAADSLNVYGNSPLFVAVFNSRGRGELIMLLRERGADPVRANKAGQTPVGVARLIANYDVAQYFADLPADPA